MKKTLMMMIVLAAMTTRVMAQASEKDDGQELIKAFFDLYKSKGYQAAVRYSWSTNKWIPPTPDAMDGIILRLGKQVDQMGEFLGQEELKSKRVGSRFRIVSYLVYYQRDPVRFTFELYKNNQGWEISAFEFDTEFEGEIEASMKLNSGN